MFFRVTRHRALIDGVAVSVLCALIGCGESAPQPATPANKPAAEAPAQAAAPAAATPASSAAEAPTPQATARSGQWSDKPGASDPQAVPSPAATAQTTAPVAVEALAAPAEAPIKSAEPASLQAAIAAIDLRKFPLPEGAVAGETLATDLSYSSPGTIAPAYEYCLAKLLALGCKPVTEGNIKQRGDEFAQDAVEKDGFQLFVSVNKNYQDPKLVSVQVLNQGNFDPRSLPMHPQGKRLYGSPTSFMYVTPASVADVEAFTRKELAAQGWQIYEPPFTSKSDDPDHRDLTLRKRGIALSAYMGKAPAQNNQTTLQYGTTILQCELPWPANATKVEFSPHRPYLDCTVAEPLTKLVEFYRREFPALGYAPTPDLGRVDEKSARLFFNQPNEDPLQVVLTVDSADCRVVIERFPLTEMLAQQAREKEQAATPEPPAAPTVQARQLPLPEGTKNVRYVTEEAQIRFSSPQPVGKLVEFFRQKLTDLGWQENKDFTIAQENVGNMMLKKDKASLSIQMINLGLGGDTEVTIDADGIGWK